MKLSEKEEQALKKFKLRLKEVLSDNLLEVKLFGSKARGDARKDSDIDVLVTILSDDWRICDVVYGIATDILLETEICVSPKVISQKEYTRLYNNGNPFIENVIREGIVL
ncbi:TPA: nucleotidyltransferase domain-containing protein [Candidatus Poribacteria bacterium]|nr:nucleotidyltransferase domain-containing protein [Candidatus Poribacteria bacterium]